MKNKKIMMLTIAALSLFVLAACTAPASSAPGSVGTAPASSAPTAPASTPSAAPGSTPSAEGERTFTLEELAVFNGKNGQPAYVAVSGVVYDVTNVPEWANGEHASGLTAGQDLTEEITNQSPHGLRVLDDLPVVGRLA